VKVTRYRQLTDALMRMSAHTLVEVGTWNGNRARELASAALRGSRSIVYHGFDLFEDLTDAELEAELSKRPPSRAEVEASLDRFRLALSLRLRRRRFEFELHQGYTRETLPTFRRANPDFRADFVFIDGGHKVETIASDWGNCSRLVAADGVIFLDDYYGNEKLSERFGCNQLVAALRADPSWNVELLPATDVFDGIGSIQIAKVAPAR
jgi:hypothetical protein